MKTFEIIIALALPAALSLLLSFILMKSSALQKNFNHLDEKDLKGKKIPRIGGIAIVISVIISLLFMRIVFGHIFLNIGEESNFSLFFLAALIIFILGIYDDLKEAEAVKKFLLQIIAAILIFFAGFKIAEISVPFIGTKSLGFDFLSFLLTIIWVVGITNAVNIMDGLDGLAVGVSFMAALSMGVLAFISAQYHIVVMIAILLGGMIGFYPFNFPRAKIYLGDSGSMVIGFLLAVLSISGIHRKVSLAMALMIPIIILFLPILETLVTIIRRVYRRQNIFTGDTDHFHYRFLRKGFSETKATLSLIFISFLFSLAGVLFNFIQTRLRLILFIFICFIGIFLLHYLGYYSFFTRKKEQTPDE